MILSQIDGEIHGSGYFARVWEELSVRLNFKINYILSKDNSIGKLLPNGTWTGLIGMLTKNELDVAVSDFTITAQRVPYIDFSLPLLSTE